MRTIALVNHKGGVGKTTTAFNLGHALSRKSKRVLLVDLDPQANLSTWAGIIDPDPSMTDVFTDNVKLSDIIIEGENGPDVAPVSHTLAGIDIQLAGEIDSRTRLRGALKGLSAKYDFLLVDCPPSLSLLTINALVACDEVIIPTQAKVMDLAGIAPLLETLKAVRENYNSNLRLTGIVPCMYDARTNLSKEVVDQLRKAATLKGRVFRTVIRVNVKLAEAYSFEQSIFEYAPDSHGAEDYNKLANEVLRMKGDKRNG